MASHSIAYAEPVPAPAALPVEHWREALNRGRQALRARFFASADTPGILREHARLVDKVLRALWSESSMPRGLALVAVGGYGRGQLFPHSDVDVMVLLPENVDVPRDAIERLLATLWDVGLELSHAVRTLDECEREMTGDITVRTSLLEHRLIAGSRKLFGAFKQRFLDTLDVRAFYEGKMLEQQPVSVHYAHVQIDDPSGTPRRGLVLGWGMTEQESMLVCNGIRSAPSSKIKGTVTCI